MSITLAFDVYGTLIDTHGITTHLRNMIGERAESFSQKWREKQLEYSFRRGLMQNYVNFAVCTRQALDYTCLFLNISLNASQKEELLQAYRVLPAFSDVKDALSDLKSAGCRLYAFSNGLADAVDNLLKNAGIRDLFLGVVTVDDLKSFKPNPAVYGHFLRKTGASGAEAWLISSNPFDVIGAVSAGMKSAWVRRSKDVPFDPWEIEPSLVVSNLGELTSALGLCQTTRR